MPAKITDTEFASLNDEIKWDIALYYAVPRMRGPNSFADVDELDRILFRRQNCAIIDLPPFIVRRGDEFVRSGTAKPQQSDTLESFPEEDDSVPLAFGYKSDDDVGDPVKAGPLPSWSTAKSNIEQRGERLKERLRRTKKMILELAAEESGLQTELERLRDRGKGLVAVMTETLGESIFEQVNQDGLWRDDDENDQDDFLNADDSSNHQAASGLGTVTTPQSLPAVALDTEAHTEEEDDLYVTAEEQAIYDRKRAELETEPQIDASSNIPPRPTSQTHPSADHLLGQSQPSKPDVLMEAILQARQQARPAPRPLPPLRKVAHGNPSQNPPRAPSPILPHRGFVMSSIRQPSSAEVRHYKQVKYLRDEFPVNQSRDFNHPACAPTLKATQSVFHVPVARPIPRLLSSRPSGILDPYLTREQLRTKQYLLRLPSSWVENEPHGLEKITTRWDIPSKPKNPRREWVQRPGLFAAEPLKRHFARHADLPAGPRAVSPPRVPVWDEWIVLTEEGKKQKRKRQVFEGRMREEAEERKRQMTSQPTETDDALFLPQIASGTWQQDVALENMPAGIMAGRAEKDSDEEENQDSSG